MTRFITFAAFALAAATSVGIAMADEGIPNVPAQPLVSMTAPGVAGQAYPVFGGATRPVVSERFDSNAGYQSYPNFSVPAGRERLGLAQVGRVQGVGQMGALAAATAASPAG